MKTYICRKCRKEYDFKFEAAECCPCPDFHGNSQHWQPIIKHIVARPEAHK